MSELTRILLVISVALAALSYGVVMLRENDLSLRTQAEINREWTVDAASSTVPAGGYIEGRIRRLHSYVSPYSKCEKKGGTYSDQLGLCLKAPWIINISK